MTLTILYVHGIGNKPRADLLKQRWDEALLGRDLGASSRMAYWASLRYRQPLPDPVVDEIDQINHQPSAALEAMPSLPGESSEEFVAEALLEAQKESTPAGALEGAPVDSRAISAEPLEAWLRRMTYAADALVEGESAAPQPPSPFEVLPFPRQARTAAFRVLIKRTLKDVYAYFFGGLGEPIRETVRRALSGIDGPVVVVGHSLGSVIAYDVLCERGSDALDVPLFVTVGSPLGITEVQDLVKHPLQVPVAVAAWRNASDARDLVALDHTLRPEYVPADRCTDYLVTNDSGNHHGIQEYLRTVPVRQPIVELFGQ